MQDLLSKLASDDLAGIICAFLVFLAGMIVWLSLQWRLHRRSELEAALKHAMLDRGMSAAEIERVLNASFNSGRIEESEVLAARANVPAGQR